MLSVRWLLDVNERRLPGCVTRSRVPNGSDLRAAVSAYISKTAPLAVWRPWYFCPYQDATITEARDPGRAAGRSCAVQPLAAITNMPIASAASSRRDPREAPSRLGDLQGADDFAYRGNLFIATPSRQFVDQTL